MYRWVLERDEKDQPVWEIVDPDDDTIARVYTQGEAEVLVSHLNR
jgi:hypothetical protein